MRKMFEVEFIRKKHFGESWSIRAIARGLGMSRVTVRKALRSCGGAPHHPKQKTQDDNAGRASTRGSFNPRSSSRSNHLRLARFKRLSANSSNPTF